MEIEKEKIMELKNLEKEPKNQEQIKKKWNRRNYFHFIINYCFLIIFLLNWIAYKAEVYSIYTFDLFEHVKKNLYENRNFTYFKFHPYSQIINECNTNDPIKNKNFFFEYFKINITQDFYAMNLKNLVTMNKSRIFTNYTRFIEMNEKVNSLNISQFKAITSDNVLIPWDMVYEEQINYFLHPLKEYKYLRPPRKLL
jgi:hypothetical protein